MHRIWLWDWIRTSLIKPWMLWTLFIVNFLGTIGGFFWYKQQLIDTAPKYLLIFVPDSPTASGLFTLVLLMFLLKKKVPFLEVFAAVTIFKYGIWAVVMIVVGQFMGNPISLLDWMLIVTHTGMALEGALYRKYYSFGFKHLAAVAVWTLSNDLLDYTLDIHPWLPREMEPYDHWFGWFTVLLSLFSLWIFSRSTPSA